MTEKKTSKNNTFFDLPKEALEVIDTLEKGGYEAYLIGGCVRDLFLGRTPKDWDATTNATPAEIIKLFPKTFYENDFGTVGVVFEEAENPTLKVIEITPYRLEGKYTNNRHPDEVRFSKNLEDDLKRRDFTINALALGKKSGEFDVVDLFGGKVDLQKGIVKTVGDAHERFNEDGLRILRAVRIATELGFLIDPDTEKAIVENVSLLKNISQERIRDEFVRIISSDSPMKGIMLCKKLGLIHFIIPELEEGIGTTQNQAHSYDVFEHLLRSLEHSAKKKFSLEVRLASLLHDIGKPPTRRFSDEKKDYTFYGHDVVGARIAKKILERLKFSNKIIETVTKLVRWHMFFSDTEQITLSAVRRMVRNVGPELIWELMNVRASDRMGMGRPKESPYRLRKYHSMIDEALRDPVSVAQLKIGGEEIIKKTNIAPGPKIGFILHILLDEVLDDPKKNTESDLEKRAIELSKLTDKELKDLGEKAKERKEKEEEDELKKLRDRHHVE